MPPRIEREYDVIVVGGGHAGTEAAVAAARAGASVALVTSTLETIGQLSCNPAIGGVAKGTVVREVDALGGIMGRAADRATVQFRMLNRGKGPAVWSPRAQCDRGLYRRAVRSLLEAHPRLHTVQGTADALLLDDAGSAVGLSTLEGRSFGARSVVVTTGTFGRGRMHIGTSVAVGGGRAGEGATTHLSRQLEAAGLEVRRFKTGTPPRIDGRTVDLARLARQDSELHELGFRWSHFPDRDVSRGTVEQLPCWITWLEEPGRALIAAHLHESAMYGGAIGSRGPRYCPSVEDKIVRFPDAERHQLFLEPEGLETRELYVNGLSTSLPPAVQLAVLRTVPGLERVEMTRAGYAIEYDYYPPTQLDSTLAVRAVPGLWLAGQVNGTTGYEEAAGQGTIAGLNAALAALGRPPLVLGRETSYLGVLVDDIVSRGVDEPYRLFTSRSEFRLTVRQDNALRRLAPVADELGLHSAAEREVVARRIAREDDLVERARRTSVTPPQAAPVLAGAGEPGIPHAMRIAEVVMRPGVGLAALFEAAGTDVAAAGPDALASAELEIKYGPYLARERAQADRMQRLGGFRLSPDLPYAAMLTISTEARQKLAAQQPATLAQASRIPGVRPTDLQNLVVEVERRGRTGTTAPAE